MEQNNNLKELLEKLKSRNVVPKKPVVDNNFLKRLQENIRKRLEEQQKNPTKNN